MTLCGQVDKQHQVDNSSHTPSKHSEYMIREDKRQPKTRKRGQRETENNNDTSDDFVLIKPFVKPNALAFGDAGVTAREDIAGRARWLFGRES